MKVYLTSMKWFNVADNIETLTINKDYKSEKDQNTDALIDELF